jgi:hypothetical protein
MNSRTFLAATLAVLAIAFGGAGGSAFANDKTILWKPAEQAILRVDDHPLASWNVYQQGKKANPLLIQMGSRFLLVDGHDKQVFEIDPAKIGHKGADLSWDPADRPQKPLDTSDWLVRDVGLAYRIAAKLVTEGHVLNVQIPHPLDIRSVYR